MRPFLLTALLLGPLLLGSAPLWAASEDPVAKAQGLMASEDADAKRAAIRALGSKGAGNDEAALSLLVGALLDRQVGEAANNALASRTGERPANSNWGTGANPQRVQEAWSGWIERWKLKQKTAALDKKINPEPVAPSPVVASNSTPATSAPVQVQGTRLDPALDDLGRVDRISFKDGGSLLAYVRSRRTDADGNLLSIQIVHRDGHGTETLNADLIARIDEDVE